MTITEGTKIYSPSSSYVWEQAGIDIAQSGDDFTIKRYARAHSSGINDPQTSVATGSSPGGSDAFTMNVSDSWKLISTETFVGTPGVTYTFGHYIDKATIYFSPSSSPSVSVDGFFVPYLAPEAPDTVVVTQNSDTSHTVGWVTRASSQARVQTTYVQRRQWSASWGSWGSWATVKTLTTDYTSDASRSWTDTTTVADRIYQYRVQSANSTATTSSATSVRAYTTPNPPTGVTATKVGSDILVEIAPPTNNSPDCDTLIEESQDGGAYATLSLESGKVEEYLHVAPSAAVTHKYRVSYVVNAVDGEGDGLQSITVESGTVELAAAPNAPTWVSVPAIHDATEDLLVTFQHNPVDTSAMEAFKIRHRDDPGNAWTEVTVTGAAGAVEEWTLPADTYANPDTVELEVATKGQHVDYSAWSATASATSSTRPTVSINSPADAGTVVTSKVTVEWTYYDVEATAQSQYRVRLKNAGGTVVKSISGSGTTDSLEVDHTLADGTDWTLEVEALDGSGLWSDVVSVGFSVAYAVPPTPLVVLEWDPETASVDVGIYNPGPTGEEIDAVSNDVYMSVDGGTYEKVAEAVPLGTTVTIYHPRVSGDTLIYAEAVSALPSVAASDVATLTTPEAGETRSLWLSGGPGYSEVARATRGISRHSLPALEVRVVKRYRGRTLGREVSGTGTARSWFISFQYLPTGSSPRGSAPTVWEALAITRGPLLLRDADGDLYVYVSVSGMSLVKDADGVVRGSFTAQEVGRD